MSFTIPTEALALIESYKLVCAALDERQKAQRAVDILAIVPCLGGLQQVRIRAVSKEMGITTYELQNWHYLNRSGAVATELWRRILEEKLPCQKACSLLRDARNNAALEKSTVELCLARGLAFYDTQPKSTGANGKVYLKRGRLSTAARMKKTQQVEVPVSVMAPLNDLPEAQTSDPKEGSSTKVFWFRIRTTVENFVAKQLLPEVEEIRREVILKEFERDLRIVVEDAQRKILRENKNSKNKSILIRDITRAEVIQSCRVLKMDPPRVNEEIDLKRAKKQKHRLAQLYHPDGQQGDRSKEDLLKSVLNAYDKLEQFATRSAV